MTDARINIGLLWLTLLPGIPLLVYYLRDLSFVHGLFIFALLPVAYAAVQRMLKDVRIDNLDRRAVFITGCDHGFGHLLALKCLRQGMPVFAGCLTEQGADCLRKAATDIRGRGKLDTIVVDVASDESVAAAATYLEEATRKYGGLHGIVNNAGIIGPTFFDDLLSVQNYKEVVEVNTFGVIRVTQALKHLVKKTRGRIVTISSSAARLAFLAFGPYTVSKFAVSGYCDVIRQELRSFGVSVHILEPGIFKTPMASEENVKGRLDAVWARAPAAAREEYGEKFFHTYRDGFAKSVTTHGSDRIDIVVDGFFHALTARFPNLRYQLGTDCQFMILPMSYLPTGLRDAIFSASEMLLGVPVPPCAHNTDSKLKAM